MKIKISKIRRDGGTQMRAERNSETVDEYRDKMLSGEVFPPIVVFFDGSEYWLADGFQRAEAAEDAEQTEIECDVKEGGQRDAILFACGANSVHGMRRTLADIEKAVCTLIYDDEWSHWTQARIADACNTSQPSVSRIVSRHPDSSYSQNKIKSVERGGTSYEQDTSKIGRTEKTVINSETGEIIDNPIVETVTIKPFHKPQKDNEDSDAVVRLPSKQDKVHELFMRLDSELGRPSSQLSVVSIRGIVAELRQLVL